MDIKTVVIDLLHQHHTSPRLFISTHRITFAITFSLFYCRHRPFGPQADTHSTAEKTSCSSLCITCYADRTAVLATIEMPVCPSVCHALAVALSKCLMLRPCGVRWRIPPHESSIYLLVLHSVQLIQIILRQTHVSRAANVFSSLFFSVQMVCRVQ